MSLSPHKCSAGLKVFVAAWAPSNICTANAATTAMIYHMPQQNQYMADIRHLGEFIETVIAPSMQAIRDELEARATLL